MASNAELREHFRIALSYREKAQGLQQESARAWSAGKIDNVRYEKLSRFYSEHLRLASKDLAHWREEAAARTDQLKAEHGQLTRDFQRVRQEESLKRIEPERAAQERARLEREIAWHRAAITELQQLSRADSSAAVGGFMDLPLEAYRGGQSTPAPPERKGWRWTWEAVVLVLALALVGFALVLALPLFTDSDWFLWGNAPPKLECAFFLDEDQEKSLTVDCRNVGDRPIQLYLPWPDAAPPPGELDEREFGGIEVQLRARGGEELQSYPVPAEWWLHSGAPVNEGEPVVVDPLLTVRLVLDIAMVRSIGEGMEAIRLVAKRSDGEVFDSYEHEFSKSPAGVPNIATRPTAAPVSARRPEPVGSGRPAAQPAAAAPEPDATAEQPEPAPVSEEPEEVVEEEAGPPVYAYVSFLGSVGGKVVLGLRLSGELSPQRKMVEVGDEIGGGWLVDALERNVDQEVVLVHASTGRTVWVRQGASEPVALIAVSQ